MMYKQHLGEKPPLVSVVIPNFNCLSYLPKTLMSIALQQISDIEVIVVDDGSDDGSLDWLYRRSLTDPTLRVMESTASGPAAVRNQAIDAARGRYIAFLDADDAWMPGKLRAQLEYHEANRDVLFSFTNYWQVDELGQVLGDGFSLWERFRDQADEASGYRLMHNALPALFAENPVGTSTVVVRRDALEHSGVFDESLTSAEDLDLWLRLAKIGSVAFSNDVTTHYLLRPDSESSRFERRLQALTEINARFLEDAALLDPKVRSLSKARFACAQAQQHRIEKQYTKACRHHAQAFLHAPSKQHLKAVVVDLIRGASA